MFRRRRQTILSRLTTDSGREFGTYNNPWGATSPWRTSAIGRAAHSNSANIIATILNNGGAPNLNSGGFTCSLWSDTYHSFARAGVNGWSSTQDGWFYDNVYYPTNYVDAFNDGYPWNIEWHSAWLDQANNRFISTYKASAPATHTFRSMNAFHLNGSGWWDQTSGIWCGRASGGAPNGGLITRYDMFVAPTIDHALACCWRDVSGGQYGNRNIILSPATATDQTGTLANGVPMGACIILNSSINIDTNPAYASYTAMEKKILKAIQNYGLYVVDTSSSWAIYLQHYNHGDQAGSLSGYPSSPMSSNAWVSDCYIGVSFPGSVAFETQALNGNQPHH